MNKKVKFVLVFLVGLLTPFIAGYVFLISGGMPVATKGPPLPLERKVAHLAIHAAIGKSENLPSPIEASESNLYLGAKVYAQHCAVCHGVPQGRETSIAKGLFPEPPQLFTPDEGVTDDPIGKIYWKVKNGIRLTGMPGFIGELDDTQLWQVSLLLRNADKLNEKIKGALIY